MVSRATIRASVFVLIVLALTMFAGEAIRELHYASAHPGAYGPAKVIALACGAGAVLSLAAAIALLALTPSGEAIRRTVLILLVATAIALGIWLVALSAASSGSTGGSSGFGVSNNYFGTSLPSGRRLCRCSRALRIDPPLIWL